MKEIKCPACSAARTVEADESLKTVSCRECGEKIALADPEAGAEAEKAAEDPPTEETVLIPQAGEPAKQEGQAEAISRPSPSEETPCPSNALEPLQKPAEGPVQAAPSSRLSLSAIGVCERDLPFFDPDTGRFRVDGREITEGTRLFLYNEDGEPVFSYAFQDGMLVISPEGPVRAVQPAEAAPEAVKEKTAEAPVKEKPAPKQEVSEEEEVEEMEEEVLKAESETMAARRDRAAAKAMEQRTKHKTQARRPRIAPATEAQPKSPAAMAVTFMFTLSTLVCLGFIGWWLISGRHAAAGKNGNETPRKMTFQPVDFSSADMDISEPLEGCQGRLVQAGWKIGAAAANTGWALRQSGCIDSGVMKGGQIQRERKGKGPFRVSMQVGFLKPPENKLQKQPDKPQAAGNVSLLLEAPELRKKVHFGFGKDIEAAFVTVLSGNRKDYEQRHPMADKVTLKYNTWYKLEIEADGDYLNFIFNGLKVDGIEMKAKDIRDIAIRAAQTRALVRQFSLLEEGE